MLAIDVLLGQQQDAPPVDGILAVVDASNLRRNLYLVSQLAEIDVPLVVALNMGDIALRRVLVSTPALCLRRSALRWCPSSPTVDRGWTNCGALWRL